MYTKLQGKAASGVYKRRLQAEAPRAMRMEMVTVVKMGMSGNVCNEQQVITMVMLA